MSNGWKFTIVLLVSACLLVGCGNGAKKEDGDNVDLFNPHNRDKRFCHKDEPPGVGHGPKRADGTPLGEGWDKGEDFDDLNKPMTWITWYDAYAFARWAGKRLPDELEWEKAASWDEQAQQKRIYPWPDDYFSWSTNVSSEFAAGAPVVSEKTYDTATKQETLKAVASDKNGRSPCGAYDMAGSVWEWTDSWYDRYPGSKDRDPEYGKTYRVIRGGGYLNYHYESFRTSLRLRERPREPSTDVGFRCAYTP